MLQRDQQLGKHGRLAQLAEDRLGQLPLARRQQLPLQDRTQLLQHQRRTRQLAGRQERRQQLAQDPEDLAAAIDVLVLEPVEQRGEHVVPDVARELQLKHVRQLVELGAVQEVERLREVFAGDDLGHRRLSRLHRVGLRRGGRSRRLGLGRGGQVELARELLAGPLGQHQPFRERIDVRVLEIDELRLPQQRHHVVIGTLIELAGAVQHVEERIDLLLEPRQERQEAHPVAVEQEGQAVTVLAGGDRPAVPAEGVLVDAHRERRDPVPQAPGGLVQAGPKSLVHGVVRLIQPPGPKRLVESREELHHLRRTLHRLRRLPLHRARSHTPGGRQDRLRIHVRQGALLRHQASDSPG